MRKYLFRTLLYLLVIMTIIQSTNINTTLAKTKAYSFNLFDNLISNEKFDNMEDSEKIKFLYSVIKKKKTHVERPGVISFFLIFLLKKTGFERVEVIPPLRWKTHFSKKFLYIVDLIRPTIKIMAQK